MGEHSSMQVQLLGWHEPFSRVSCVHGRCFRKYCEKSRNDVELLGCAGFAAWIPQMSQLASLSQARSSLR